MQYYICKQYHINGIMKIKNSIATVSALGVLAVGYIAGAFIGLPNVDSSLLSGNIGKAKTFNQPDSPEVQAAMEQLANDTTLQQQTALSAAILKVRIDELNGLLASQDSIENMPEELKDVVKSFGLRADNAQKSFDEYTKALAAVMKGEKVENFEQTTNNALLAFTVVEKNIKAVAPKVVSALTETAEKNNDKKAAEMAAKWIKYGSEDAFLNNSQADMEYWQSQSDVLANSPVLAAAIQNFDKDKLAMQLANTIDQEKLGIIYFNQEKLGIIYFNQEKILGLIKGASISKKETETIGMAIKKTDVTGCAFGAVLGAAILF